VNNYNPDLVGDFQHKYATVDPITGEPIEPSHTVQRLGDFAYAREHLDDPMILRAARHFLGTCLSLR
jgi:hypothetical protein